MNYEQKHLDNTELGICPWWDNADDAEIEYMIRRMERGVRFCKGRAADLKLHVVEHIRFLRSKLRKNAKSSGMALKTSSHISP